MSKPISLADLSLFYTQRVTTLLNAIIRLLYACLYTHSIKSKQRRSKSRIECEIDRPDCQKGLKRLV